MNCKECYQHGRPDVCSACKRMQQESRWLWEIDVGNRVIRCPDCGGGLSFPAYGYKMNYRYCPYCGHQMVMGEQLSMI